MKKTGKSMEARLQSETVLVLQGGGSLGAYECGVFKALYRHGIKSDILAGSSIGAVNASIICSAQNANQNAAKVLEDFWLTLADKNNRPELLPFLSLLSSPFHSSSTLKTEPSSSSSHDISEDKTMAVLSSMYSVAYGNREAFMPRWLTPISSSDYYLPYKWNYLYDTSPLKETLKGFINFKYLKKIENENENNNNKRPSRLIITSTDIQKGEAVVFDSKKVDIDIGKIIACIGYPFYGIRWSKIDGRYLWDGSLLTNTPMLDVIHAAPKFDKIFYIIDVFPRQQKELPKNMAEVWHRARDIMFMDKTDKNIEMLKDIEKYQSLLKRINDIINTDDAELDEKTGSRLKELEPEYYELVQRRGAVIKEVIRIGRREKMHYLFEDADFSLYRIKKLIDEGDKDAENVIAKK